MHMWILYFFVIGISLGMLLIIIITGKINYKFFKKNYKAILSYILVLLTIFFLLISTLKLGHNEAENFLNMYIIFMLSCGASVILVSPIIALLQKHEEQKIIKKYEGQYIIDKFYYYRELVGDISPAILFWLYNKNNDIEDLIVVTYIHMLRKGLIKIKNDKIVRTNVTPNYLHENLLIQYFTGEITKKKLQNNILNYLNQDIKNNNFIYASKKNVNFTECMELIIAWIIITQLIMMPAIVSLIFNGIYLFITYLLAFIAIPIYKGVIKSIHPFFKSDESLQIIAKLNGLKQFYEKFNIINDKSIKEIVLYEDYIIYGIIFNNKGKLNKEAHKLYKQISKLANQNKSIALKEASKMKIIDLDKNEWRAFSITFFIALSSPCLVYLDPQARNAPYMCFLWLLPLSVITIALLASHQNKRKKKKERNLI